MVSLKRFTKQLSIGAASLLLIAPLALSSVNANASNNVQKNQQVNHLVNMGLSKQQQQSHGLRKSSSNPQYTKPQLNYVYQSTYNQTHQSPISAKSAQERADEMTKMQIENVLAKLLSRIVNNQVPPLTKQSQQNQNLENNAVKKLPDMKSKSQTQTDLISYIHNGKAQIKKVRVQSNLKPQQQEYRKMRANKANYKKLQRLNKKLTRKNKKRNKHSENKIVVPNESLRDAKRNQTPGSQINVSNHSLTISPHAFNELKKTTQRVDLQHLAKYLRISAKNLAKINHMRPNKQLRKGQKIIIPVRNPKLSQLIAATLSNASGKAWENYNNKYDHLSKAQIAAKHWIAYHESTFRYDVLAGGRHTKNPFGRWHKVPYGKYQLDPVYLKHDASIANQELAGELYVISGRNSSGKKTWTQNKRFHLAHGYY